MMEIQKNREGEKEMLPISKSHMYCCHTDVAVRTSNPKKCTVCGDSEWWNRKNQGKYKPRKDSVKLRCNHCNKDYYVTPKILAIKESMGEEIKFADANADSQSPDLPKVINK